MFCRLKTSVVVAMATVVLFGAGLTYWGHGMYRVWGKDADGDLRSRYQEYVLFSDHIYPHRRVAEAAGRTGVRMHTVYPPYSFPMFAAVFWAPSFIMGRVTFQVLSLAGLAVLIWYGISQLRFAGRAAAWLGAAVPFAFSGHSTAIAIGQFSIICTALIILQIILLGRGRPILAGCCWALAMLKPQIALPFAILFLVRPQWRGLAAGVAILGSFTAFALWWTGVMPWDFWHQGVESHKLTFITRELYGAGLWVDALGINPRLAVLGALGVIALCAMAMMQRRVREKMTMETTAALCAVLGYTLFYHVHYDNMMLLPLLLPLLACLLRRPSIALFAATGLLAFTVYAPPRIPATEWIVLLAPTAALCVLLTQHFRQARMDQQSAA